MVEQLLGSVIWQREYTGETPETDAVEKYLEDESLTKKYMFMTEHAQYLEKQLRKLKCYAEDYR